MDPRRLSDDLDRQSLLPTSYPPSPPSAHQHQHPPIPSLPSRNQWRAFLASRTGRITLFCSLTLLALLGAHAIFQPNYKQGVQQVYDWASAGHSPYTDEDSLPLTLLPPPPASSSAPDSDYPGGGGIMAHPPPPDEDDDEGTGYAYGAHVEGHEWTLAELGDMVGRTKGYYVRDWSLGLGWNNMRYIIEASLLHAQLLNRTLVLPSFVYMRGCEFAHEVCAAYAPQVDRFKEVGWKRDEVGRLQRRDTEVERSLGMGSDGTSRGKRDDAEKKDDHTGWRVPIEYMLDLPHLRSLNPTILVSEYLSLHSLNPTDEWKSGMWGRWSYQKDNTYYMIPNREYDPQEILRVDRLLPEAQRYLSEESWTERGRRVRDRLQEARGGEVTGVLEWEDVKRDLRGGEGGVDVEDEEELEGALREGGLSVLYTFQGSRGIDLIKHVTEPIRQVAPTRMLKGVVDDWGTVPDQVLLLEGEIHLWRKPGSLRFTTAAARREFESIVLHSMRPHPRVLEIGELMARHMSDRVGGRMWYAGHLRRGDFVQLGWALEHDIAPHLKMLTDNFAKGREVLREIKESGGERAADVPGVEVNRTVWSWELPQEGDPFFLATDERGAEELAYCRSQGALLTPDIISFADRRLYGWELLFSDIVMLVEQVTMSQASWFYGYGASSVAGGTMNQRAGRGMDPRTGVVE